MPCPQGRVPFMERDDPRPAGVPASERRPDGSRPGQLQLRVSGEDRGYGPRDRGVSRLVRTSRLPRRRDRSRHVRPRPGHRHRRPRPHEPLRDLRNPAFSGARESELSGQIDEPRSIMDAAPTIAYYLGARPPTESVGQVLGVREEGEPSAGRDRPGLQRGRESRRHPRRNAAPRDREDEGDRRRRRLDRRYRGGGPSGRCGPGGAPPPEPGG